MRRSPVLEALFPKVRSNVLATLLLQPEKKWYLTELALHLGSQPSSLQREVDALSRAGLLEQTRDGRRVYFQADKNSPVFPELRGLLEKTEGIVPILQQELVPFSERILVAFVYGSIASSVESSGSDLDLMIVGDLGISDLVPLLRRMEKRFGRPVNPTVYSRKEFRATLKNKDHFLVTVVRGIKKFVKGDDGVLATLSG